MSRRYTSHDDEAIRAGWPDVAGLASALGRTRQSLVNRAIKLDLRCASGRPKRPFTDVERQTVIDRYPTEGALPLAREMGRARADLVSFAQRIGVICNKRWTKEVDDRLVALRRRGSGHAAIGAALGRSTTACSTRAQKLGLTTPGYDAEERRRQLVSPHPAAGGMIEVRWARARLAVGEHGWPPDLNPKEVAILESLRVRGPQTRVVLSSSIGEPSNRHRFKRLMTHGGRSAVARLLARGLVTRCYLTDGRKKTVIYALTAHAQESRGTYPSVASFNAPIAATARGVGPIKPSTLEKAS